MAASLFWGPIRPLLCLPGFPARDLDETGFSEPPYWPSVSRINPSPVGRDVQRQSPFGIYGAGPLLGFRPDPMWKAQGL